MSRPGTIAGSRGIRRKIALFSWSITIITLLIFVIVIIPEQKRIFQQGFNSKARSVAVSLQEFAGAVVNEDFSEVVDRCQKLLKGDSEISYIVVTRGDGFSVICERSGWRSQILDESWRPKVRATTSTIDTAPLSGQRVFHCARPLDYSGIEWGWIHVGLALENYDRSVAAVYWRTCLLAVVCIAISLVASLGYARQFVRPIHSLETSVRKVAGGDLSARADITSGDEVESLAQSFNRMTDALRRRDQILESVRFAAQELLSKDEWKLAIPEVLARLGQAAGTGRAYIFENHLDAEGVQVWSHRFEWVAPGVLHQIDDPAMQNLRWKEVGMEDWAQTLAKRRIVVAHTRQLDPQRQKILGPTIQSLILIPIVVQGQWWGFLGFDQCDREREWSNGEKDSFRAASDMIGAAIERQHTRDALLDAKQTLEQRVEERTRELKEQVDAKEKAHAALAEAQQRLLDASRRAGMAEIATGVLHNVGNVLNSVNVSATLVRERLSKSEVSSLVRLAGLLKEHTADMDAFLTADPKGKLVPGFVIKLADHYVKERARLQEELDQLGRNVEHIKEIVAMQQSYASVSGFLETVAIAQLVDDALHMNLTALSRHGVEVVRQYEEVPPVTVDKHKVLQILVNLVRNARFALDEGGRPGKLLTACIKRHGPNRVRVTIQDNGVGIPNENLTRIFSHGFTTRKGGHGFGLHSGANAAREIGGALTAHSEGPGKGATFILELPVHDNGGTRQATSRP